MNESQSAVGMLGTLSNCTQICYLPPSVDRSYGTSYGLCICTGQLRCCYGLLMSTTRTEPWVRAPPHRELKSAAPVQL